MSARRSIRRLLAGAVAAGAGLAALPCAARAQLEVRGGGGVYWPQRDRLTIVTGPTSGTRYADGAGLRMALAVAVWHGEHLGVELSASQAWMDRHVRIAYTADSLGNLNFAGLSTNGTGVETVALRGVVRRWLGHVVQVRAGAGISHVWLHGVHAVSASNDLRASVWGGSAMLTLERPLRGQTTAFVFEGEVTTYHVGAPPSTAATATVDAPRQLDLALSLGVRTRLRRHGR